MIEDKKYTVYKHTTPSGKVYIGITERKPEKRWDNGNGYKNNKHFYRAILKYDWKNIKHEIVENGLTKEQACNLEIELIAKYDATNPRKGYNHSTGGEINKGYHLSPEARRKISESHKGQTAWNKGKHPNAETRKKKSYAWKHSVACIEHLKKVCESNKGANHPFYGKHHSAETRQKISEAKKGANHPNYGKHLSAETRWKISESNKGKKHKLTDEGMSALIKAHKGKPPVNRKQVVCLETNEIFSSASEAAAFIGLSKDRVAATCRGEQKTAGGYHWKYVEEQS